MDAVTPDISARERANMMRFRNVDTLPTHINMAPFFKQDGKQIEQMLDTNVYHVAATARKLLPGLVARSKKTGLIIVSSITEFMPADQGTVYSATKAFVGFLARSLKIENPDLDILCLQPGWVATPMIKGFTFPFSISTPADVVKCAMRDLGYQTCTYGTITSAVSGSVGLLAL